MLHARPDHRDRFVDLGPNGDASRAIPSDEPVVILRGKDLAAPKALLAWADENDRLIDEGKNGPGDKRLSNAMRLHARRMIGYQENTGTKRLADIPEGLVLQDDGLFLEEDTSPTPTPAE